MKREIINPPGASTTAPLSAAVKMGNLMYTAGQVGVDREKGEIPSDIKEQTRLCFENLADILKEAGTDFDNVLKANVYLTNISEDFEAMNEVYREYFPADFPARTAVGIEALANDKLKVEIELVVLVPEGEK